MPSDHALRRDVLRATLNAQPNAFRLGNLGRMLSDRTDESIRFNSNEGCFKRIALLIEPPPAPEQE